MSIVYMFLDESGNFDFSTNGTPYFVLGCTIVRRPCPLYHELVDLRFDLLEDGHELEMFHASEDKQAVRDRVFEALQCRLPSFAVHSLIVEKAKTSPHLQAPEMFYPKMLGYLLRYAIGRVEDYDEIIVMTDSVPVKKKRRAIEKGVKSILTEMLPRGVPYRVLHHDSKSCIGIQIADYCTWAIARKWRDGDTRSYDIIQPAIRSEFNIFRRGRILYY